MKIARTSWWIKWAYFLDEEDDLGSTVNLCPLFWRIVFLTPLKGIFCGFILLIFGPTYAVLWCWKQLQRVLGVDVGPYINPLIEGVIAIKKRMCPIVEIEDAR
jgi:hypothetical protein